MTAPSRTKELESPEPRESPSQPADKLSEALERVARELSAAIAECRRVFCRESLRARKAGHLVEAAIHAHLAARFSSVNSMETYKQVLDEATELLSWLPIPAKYRDDTVLERKAWKIHFFRSLGVDRADEMWLISLGTQAPGRPAETRGVVVRALELRNKGQGWPQVERQLLPHRRGVRNPGESIRREVQLLRAVLQRHGVPLSGPGSH